MRGRLFVALMVWAVLAVPATRAQTAEPNVYFFWSASCPYSKMARTFLLNAQQKDANVSLREFEVDQSLPNTLLLGRDRKSTRLNSSHSDRSRMPSSA